MIVAFGQLNFQNLQMELATMKVLSGILLENNRQRMDLFGLANKAKEVSDYSIDFIAAAREGGLKIKGPKPNYCLRDTVASMMLSNGATLAEVAHQLGHAPGSPMTKRYAKFIPAAQQSIANKAQEAMSLLLKHPADQVAKSGWYPLRSSQTLISHF